MVKEKEGGGRDSIHRAESRPVHRRLHPPHVHTLLAHFAGTLITYQAYVRIVFFIFI